MHHAQASSSRDSLNCVVLLQILSTSFIPVIPIDELKYEGVSKHPSSYVLPNTLAPPPRAPLFNIYNQASQARDIYACGVT